MGGRKREIGKRNSEGGIWIGVLFLLLTRSRWSLELSEVTEKIFISDQIDSGDSASSVRDKKTFKGGCKLFSYIGIKDGRRIHQNR